MGRDPRSVAVAVVGGGVVPAAGLAGQHWAAGGGRAGSARPGPPPHPTPMGLGECRPALGGGVHCGPTGGVVVVHHRHPRGAVMARGHHRIVEGGSKISSCGNWF